MNLNLTGYQWPITTPLPEPPRLLLQEHSPDPRLVFKFVAFDFYDRPYMYYYNVVGLTGVPPVKLKNSKHLLCYFTVRRKDVLILRLVSWLAWLARIRLACSFI